MRGLERLPSLSLSLPPISGTHLCALEANAVLNPKVNPKLKLNSCADWRDSRNTQTPRSKSSSKLNTNSELKLNQT